MLLECSEKKTILADLADYMPCQYIICACDSVVLYFIRRAATFQLLYGFEIFANRAMVS